MLQMKALFLFVCRMIAYFFINLFGLKVMAKCGHKTKLKGKVKVCGEEEGVTLPFEPQLCIDCLEKQTIHCAWCEKPIMPGDSITLYSPRDKENFVIPEHAVIYNKERLSLVGCLRWECAEGGIDRMGYWGGKEGVQRQPSPLEMCLATGKAVIMPDTSSGEMHVVD